MNRVRVYTDYDRRYNREYFRLVRGLVLPPHPYNKQTCCADCLRVYNRNRMRRIRAEARGEISA